MARRGIRSLTAVLAPLALAFMPAGCGNQPAPEQPPAFPPAGPASFDPWILSTERVDDTYRGAYLGSGLLGARISHTGFPAAGPDAPPAFVAGLYRNEALAGVPGLLPLELRSNGQVFGALPGQFRRYRQELRLREGLLVTRATWDAGSGEIDVEVETALLLQEPGMALARTSVDNRSGSPVEVAISSKAAGLRLLPNQSFTISAIDRTDLVAKQVNAEAVYTLPAKQSARFAAAVRLIPASGATIAGVPVRGGLLRAVAAEQVEAWLSGHRAAWGKLWSTDIEIEGDPEAQQVVRACLFHLFSSIREDSAAGMPPMGLSSGAFNGHVFWDMDSWMLPALLPQHPELARAMLEYRYRTLGGARANARAESLPGASYAWESGASGRETVTGEFSFGRHVTGDVALAMKQYYTATGDREWLRNRAWPVLRETADNWVARARAGRKPGEYVVKGVQTPDELARKVDHSAWTHHVARVNLEFAAEAAATVGQPANPRWKQVAAGLTFLKNPESDLILPYAGFTDRTRAKQADVLLLAHPGGLRLPDAEWGRMYDYYEPRVIENGPAMTDAIHAIIAARLGRGEEALKQFRASYQPFTRPPFLLFSEKRSRDNLCFLTGEAGVVEGVLYGFAGLRLEPDPKQPDRPRLEPHLPPGWEALRIRGLRWRGAAWDVEIRPTARPVWKRTASS